MRTAVLLYFGCSGAFVAGLLLGAVFAAAERAEARQMAAWWAARDRARGTR